MKKILELVLFVFALAVFCYSGYKVANYYGLLDKKVSAEETCGQCSACDSDNWLGELCRRMRDWCQGNCNCNPTPTQPPVPTPTTVVPTPTPTPENPTVTPSLPTVTVTVTPKPEENGGIGGPSDGGGSGSNPASPPVCTDAVPPKPYLRDLKVLGNGKVSLFWDLVDPATHYSIGYGPSSGKYLFGVDNTRKTNSFIIGELGTGNYCFAVKGVNNCMPGEFSNERCTASSGKVLGASVLGATGSFNDNLLNILFIMGSICSSVAVRLLSANRKLG